MASAEHMVGRDSLPVAKPLFGACSYKILPNSNCPQTLKYNDFNWMIADVF
jgi:hypothetical protein